MEAASIAEAPSGLSRARDSIREFLGAYGLIIVLLAMPVYYGISDIVNHGTLAPLGNNLVDGVSNGAIWALVALGYTLVYGIIELINFAHGDVFMIGSFVAVGLYGTLGLTLATGTIGVIPGLIVCVVVAMIACGTLNVMIERVAYRPLRDAPKLAPLITAVGFSFILQNVGLLWFGGTQRSVPDFIDSQGNFASVAGVHALHGDVLAVPRLSRWSSHSRPSSRAHASARRCAPPRRTPRRRG